MKKLISFQEIADMWAFCDTCIYNCKKRWCPIWKKLEKPEKGLVEMWQMASSYLLLCHPCVHNTPDDQICDHTGFDKRTVKECPYMQPKEGI